MKKTFQLQVEGKHPDRLLEAIKHDIRKYLKRERRRDVPAGADFWDFDCKFGLTEDTSAQRVKRWSTKSVMRLTAWMTTTTIDCFCVACVDSQAPTKKPPY